MVLGIYVRYTMVSAQAAVSERACTKSGSDSKYHDESGAITVGQAW